MRKFIDWSRWPDRAIFFIVLGAVLIGVTRFYDKCECELSGEQSRSLIEIPSSLTKQAASIDAVSPAALRLDPPTSTASLDLYGGAVRNLAEKVQTAIGSNSGRVKSDAAWIIDYCKNFLNHAEAMREATIPIGGDIKKISRYLEIRGAECQSLAPNDLALLKQFASDAYKLGAVDGAYLHAKENGIPDDPAERKAWLEALKSAAYAGNGLSQSFVGAKVGAMFEDRDEAIGFRMLPLRSMENFANLPDHALYPLISLKPDYDKNSESVQRAVAVMNRLREAREQSKRK